MTGAEARAVAPSGVVTFLFTDVEGSTRRWEADPQAMRAALEAHDQALHAAVEGNRGRLFKHTGDGVCAAFASPRAAIDAGVAAQRALELPVRMGVATGEAELRGGDYFGAVLNRAARVMAAGHGGQVLLDGATAGLLSGIDLADLGSRRLRDIANPVEIFQLRAPGLRPEFPPLKTLDSTPGNLRPPTTTFVGRDAELAEVEAALNAHRLVTLTGVGGVGKTRLALEVATRIAHDFTDGVWVIELAAIGDPAAVPEAVAAALGITQQPGMSVADSVAQVLEGRKRLLVFDNCEHVLDAAADLVEAILNRSATVRILATSREGLRVFDERLWPVPTLDIDTGVDSPAATLFVERASAVAPRDSLTEYADAVVEICRRLDGIPLGIELAASRMLSMSASEVRDRLDDRFRLLVGSRRGLERHQTLRHAVQWSYDLLDDIEKSLLARCSVFAGGFDLPGACAVGGLDDEFVTLDLLDALVRKSLLVADRSSGRTRFSMLETIRQFAAEQLVHDGMANATRTAHSRYFASREADILAVWDSPRQREAYTWLTVELSNLRAAFRWAADQGDLDTAATIAVVSTFLGYWVDQHEPVVWAEELIDPAKTVGHPRLAQLYVMAAQCWTTGRIEDFLGYAEAGEELIESGRFDAVPDEFEAPLSGGYLTAGRLERSVVWCRNAIERSPGRHVLTRASLVMALVTTGATGEAMAASAGLIADADAAEHPEALTWALLAYGMAYQDTDPAAAYDAHHRGLAIARESGNKQIESHFAVGLSRFASTHSEPAETLGYLTLAIRNHHDSGSVAIMHTTFFDRLGHLEAAATISGFAANPFTRAALPEIETTINHLRDVLGDQAYESFARAGERMTNAAMVAYALEQIDQARARVTG